MIYIDERARLWWQVVLLSSSADAQGAGGGARQIDNLGKYDSPL
jgi:hypothetical protein